MDRDIEELRRDTPESSTLPHVRVGAGASVAQTGRRGAQPRWCRHSEKYRGQECWLVPEAPPATRNESPPADHLRIAEFETRFVTCFEPLFTWRDRSTAWRLQSVFPDVPVRTDYTPAVGGRPFPGKYSFGSAFTDANGSTVSCGTGPAARILGPGPNATNGAICATRREAAAIGFDCGAGSDSVSAPLHCSGGQSQITLAEIKPLGLRAALIRGTPRWCRRPR
jgi:hypothetical protein